MTLSAEKGYSRETGNLLFHVALLVSLVLIAVGRLYSYQGTIIVPQGSGFCNAVSKYDSWQPGRFAAEGKVAPAPFCIDDLTKFTATYTASGEASEFYADVTYQPSTGGSTRRATISVNHPLRIEGDRVYLIGHGYTPLLTVRMPDGRVLHDSPTFAPTNPTTFLSEGVSKLQGADGKNQDVGISGLFAPTPQKTPTGYTSISPRVNNPVLDIQVWQGDLNYQGQPQSIYTLDTSKMHSLGLADLRVGQTKKFANGVEVTFAGWKPWASIQVSHDPAQGYLLFSAGAMVLGLLGSLGVRRRRLWLRMTPSSETPDGSLTVVSVGGLARSDSGNFTTEFAGLLERLRSAGRPVQEQLVPAGRE